MLYFLYFLASRLKIWGFLGFFGVVWENAQDGLRRIKSKKNSATSARLPTSPHAEGSTGTKKRATLRITRPYCA